MKYILINIKNFVKNETIIFLLCILCIFCSAVIVNFSFGFYHHLEQKKIDATSEADDFYIAFEDETRSVVKKGKLMEILLNLSDKAVKDCNIEMDCRYEQYNTEDPIVDKYLYSSAIFKIIDGKITVAASLGESWKKNNFLTEGDYFTAEQIENGEYVCITEPEDIIWGNEGQQEWKDLFGPDEEGYCVIDGKKYKVIGVAEYTPTIHYIPITTVDADCFVQNIVFSYKNPITRSQYNEICKAIKEAYGDIAVIEELDIKDLDSQRFYNVLIILSVLLALLAGIVLAMLYKYIILQRKKNLTIYRLCGISKVKASIIYFLECLLLTAVTYGVGVLIYEKLILPYLSNIFEYISESYSIKVYSVLGIIYVSTVLCVLLFIIRRQIKDNIANELRGV